MATLVNKIIAHLGRTPDFETEVILQDDGAGAGPYIKTWNAAETQPTSVQLDAADGAATTAQALQTVQDTRKDAYPSVADFMEAYTEKEIGSDSTKWDAYVIAYNKVRTDNPKP
tara:strand:- start:358 stop:699 length:342 start_codon:yes stop_codon:yes gene_type:complete